MYYLLLRGQIQKGFARALKGRYMDERLKHEPLNEMGKE